MQTCLSLIVTEANNQKVVLKDPILWKNKVKATIGYVPRRAFLIRFQRFVDNFRDYWLPKKRGAHGCFGFFLPWERIWYLASFVLRISHIYLELSREGFSKNSSQLRMQSLGREVHSHATLRIGYKEERDEIVGERQRSRSHARYPWFADSGVYRWKVFDGPDNGRVCIQRN